jgi:hypothetical protein
MPHRENYDRWIKNISKSDYQKISDTLNSQFDSTEVNVSSLIPGGNWKGTVWEPISNACDNDRIASSCFFGLIVFDIIMKRKDVWGIDKFEISNWRAESTIYYILNNPPSHKGVNK